MNLFHLFVIWAVLFVVILVLLMYRRRLTIREDDTVHIMAGEEKISAEQARLARKLTLVDRWGKIFTAVLVLSALVVGAIYVYLQFTSSSTVRMG